MPSGLGRFQGGDWQGVIDHIDYLRALGVTAVWVSPVVRNVDTDANFDSYHGYWAQDLTHTNPHFGSLADLRRMVQALMSRLPEHKLDARACELRDYLVEARTARAEAARLEIEGLQ